MPLTKFEWNNLYSAHLNERAFVETRILDFYSTTPRLEQWGVDTAFVTYVLLLFSTSPALTACSPTGWHGRKDGGHITVHFRRGDDHKTTLHVPKIPPQPQRRRRGKRVPQSQRVPKTGRPSQPRRARRRRRTRAGRTGAP